MDYSKLSGVHTQITDAAAKEQEAQKEARRQAVRDAIAKHREEVKKRVQDSEHKTQEKPSKETPVGHPKAYAGIKDSASYPSILKKVKDELSETEDTESAIDAVLDLLHEAPAEQVLSATVEVLGEAIDALQEEEEPAAPADPEE